MWEPLLRLYKIIEFLWGRTNFVLKLSKRKGNVATVAYWQKEKGK